MILDLLTQLESSLVFYYSCSVFLSMKMRPSHFTSSQSIQIAWLKYIFALDFDFPGEGQDKLAKFKKWFWSILENMTSKQKQDLVSFYRPPL